MSETSRVVERSYRWKRNKQLIFLGSFVLVFAGALWLLVRGYPAAWLLIVAALLGSLQPVFVLWSLRRLRDDSTTVP